MHGSTNRIITRNNNNNTSAEEDNRRRTINSIINNINDNSISNDSINNNKDDNSNIINSINSSVIIRARLSIHAVVIANAARNTVTAITDPRINGAKPNRALRRAVNWLMAKNDAAFKAKHRLNCVGVRPKYSMYTNGALPINTKNVASPKPLTTARPVNTGSRSSAP